MPESPASYARLWDPLLQPDDPYPIYRRLRDEAPLYYAPSADIWALTRFDDVQQASKDCLRGHWRPAIGCATT